MDEEDGHIIEEFTDEVTIQTTNTNFLTPLFNFINSTIYFIESNGWFLLVGFIIIYFIYNHIKQYLSRIFNRQSSTSRSILNENESLDRMRRIEEVRLRQQAALDAAAQKYLEEKKRKEEEESKRKAEEWERHKQGLGYRDKIKKNENQDDTLSDLGLSSSNMNKKPKAKLRGSDYNPLTGSSNSSDGGVCYRPSKRGGSRGG